LGWTWADSGTPGITCLIIARGGVDVGGAFATPAAPA
jgi:hypothetical protein